MTLHPQSGSLAILIPTYGRDQVLIDSIADLLALESPAEELLILDQTVQHRHETEVQLQHWHDNDQIRWVRIPTPSIPAAMNLGLSLARSERVLFLDDDIVPDPQLLVAHRQAAARYPGAMIAGRVLQPWHQGQLDPSEAAFRFNSAQGRDLDEFMGGNVSLDRQKGLQLGGFDRNFVRVAYRFEAEFAHRWRQAGQRIRYEPSALIHHLKVGGGGTRSYGNHLTTMRPDHAVGRYYYLLRTTPPLQAWLGCLAAVMGSVRSRHHLHRPWWIPLTLLAELRGLLWACRLALQGPGLLPQRPLRLLVATSHPIQYQVPLFRDLAADPELQIEVLYLSIPDAARQGSGFGRAFAWDLPLLEGYAWRRARSLAGDGDLGRFRGLWLRRPGSELSRVQGAEPDALLITGWHCLGLLQLIVAARLRRLPILLRMEANDGRKRSRLQRCLHRWLVGSAAYALPIGCCNARFYRRLGFPESRLVPSPYGVDNTHFVSLAAQIRPRRNQLREMWGIPEQSFCFVFCGKLQAKKRPTDLLAALHLLQQRPGLGPLHLLIVGTEELEADLQDQVRRQNLPVSFAGFLNQRDVPAAYLAGDALVLPSDCGETWGLVVNEAMACDRPAVVSDQVGCVEDLVISGKTGLRYSCGHVEALAQAMQDLASDQEEARAMGTRAGTLVRSKYSIATATAGIQQALAMLRCTPIR